jgi:cytokinesis protein
VKCLKQILNNPVRSFASNIFVDSFSSQVAARDALTHHLFVTQLASSLNTPHLPTRKLLLELLSFIAYWNDGETQPAVISALEALSAANNEPDGCYSYWFKSLEQSLTGRGKMGSLVGASDEVRRAGGIDSSLNEYAVRGTSTFRLEAHRLILYEPASKSGSSQCHY